ncbi:MAG: Dabb family protein [Cyclobacteriaceae bacterium]|nr:Dabb family protein [Cyclobacteriaceae bacterium]
MITHIVFLNVKPELNKEEILDVLNKKLLYLNQCIDELEHLEFGFNFNASPAAYDAALFSTFTSKENLEAYQVHPEHIKVKDYISEVTSARAVVDYES